MVDRLLPTRERARARARWRRICTPRDRGHTRFLRCEHRYHGVRHANGKSGGPPTSVYRRNAFTRGRHATPLASIAARKGAGIARPPPAISPLFSFFFFFLNPLDLQLRQIPRKRAFTPFAVMHTPMRKSVHRRSRKNVAQEREKTFESYVGRFMPRLHSLCKQCTIVSTYDVIETKVNF